VKQYDAVLIVLGIAIVLSFVGISVSPYVTIAISIVGVAIAGYAMFVIPPVDRKLHDEK
jgi:uncharacterized membrane protein YgaE (UPF0421/DUF939 family)